MTVLGEPDLSPAPGRRALPFVVATAVLVIAAGYGCLGPPGTIACGQATGFGPAMLESVNACPAATLRLGAPVRFSLVGAGCSNYEAGREAGDGLAYGTLRIEGSTGHASLQYQLSKGGGQWRSSVLVLTFADGTKLDVKACTQSLEQQRGQRASEKLLEAGCAQGQASVCEALGLWRKTQGDEAGAAEARRRACELGLSSACAK
jgi:hypothetical protein